MQLHLELEVAYCRLVTISTDNITVGDAGNTITHRITKRMRDGKAEPDFSGSYTRAAAASTTA